MRNRLIQAHILVVARTFIRCLPAVLCIAAILALAAPVAAADPGLVVLHDTGKVEQNLPVLARDPAPQDVEAALTKGFSGRMLRLYAWAQTYLQNKTGRTPEPAYLLFSTTQGGIPKQGLVLDGNAKPDAGYVDLYLGSRRRLVGDLGTVDQIFPHELFHIIYEQLTGIQNRQAPSARMHGTPIKTDALTAFDEGFAESIQLMAVEDPDADPATRQAMADPRNQRDLQQGLQKYRRSLLSRWSPGATAEVIFPLWFNGSEQLMRYQTVKENLLARQPAIPDRFLQPGASYRAILMENTLPGAPSDPHKTAGQMLSTEGVVAHLFYRWASDPALQNAYRDDAFYAQFGAARTDVSPVENAYLKLFHVFYTRKPASAAAVIDGYKALFPDEAPAVDAVVKEALLGQPISRGRPASRPPSRSTLRRWPVSTHWPCRASTAAP